MTDHTHTTIVPGCYRCELGQDEVAWQRRNVKLYALTLMIEFDPDVLQQQHEDGEISTRYTEAHLLDSLVEQSAEWVNDTPGVLVYRQEGSHWKEIKEAE